MQNEGLWIEKRVCRDDRVRFNSEHNCEENGASIVRSSQSRLRV
jgi:hypothetical protein